MSYSYINWIYILLYLSISLIGGSSLDILFRANAIKIPLLSKLGSFNLFCTIMLPCIALISMLIKYNLPMAVHQTLLTCIYLIIVTFITYLIVKGWGKRRTEGYNLIYVMLLIIFTYKIN